MSDQLATFYSNILIYFVCANKASGPNYQKDKILIIIFLVAICMHEFGLWRNLMKLH